jgi:hypothetical protein
MHSQPCTAPFIIICKSTKSQSFLQEFKQMKVEAQSVDWTASVRQPQIQFLKAALGMGS